MNYVYDRTKDDPTLGPGFMFIVASMLYGIGTLLVTMIPRNDLVEEEARMEGELSPDQIEAAGLEQPLLSSSE